MDKVVVVAGGPWQKYLVLFLKQKGHYVCVVNPTRTETVAAADFHIQTDVNDIVSIGKHIEQIKPIFITSDQSDISTMSVAKLSEAYGLPCNRPAVVERFSDKLVMAEFGRSIGVNVPLTSLARTAADVRLFAEENSLPVIIKPTDATNSRGFRKIDHFENLTETLDYTRKFSKAGRVIVQKYVPGEEQVTLDGVCSGGKHKTLAASKKGYYFKPGLTSCVRYPSNLPSALLDRMIKQNDRYVEESGMTFGMTHGEYIVNGNDFCLIEIAGRGAGAGIADKITPWASGINPYEILYESLMGRTVDVGQLRPLSRPAVLQFYHEDQMKNCNEEKVTGIRQIPGVVEFQYDFRGKQFAIDAYNPRHSMGVYLAESEEHLNSIISNVNDILCKK